MLKNRSIGGKNKNNLRLMGITFLIVVLSFIVIQAVNGLYPFGGKSNLLWDQDIQYVDYFAFYRDVLLGKANIGYSFSKSMGGSLLALFGYYLGCPLNIFVIFFSKEQIPLFFFLLNAVKLGLAGCTARYFFSIRFPELSEKMGVLLAVSYGLMQYAMIQSSNIMWLDGVILLPLLLLAVYRFAAEGKKAGVFLAVLFSIAINWYTGYMTLLFAIAYFIYERLLLTKLNIKGEWKRVFIDTIRFGVVMGCGVLGSCFIFFPVFKGLQNGKQAFDISIFTPYVNGSLSDIVRGLSLGSIVPVVSLYCGILMLGFSLYYFFLRTVPIREKILSGLAVGFMIVSCWFVPFECIWSGFRYAATYRYRYSFVVVFLILYLAAKGAKDFEMKKDGLKMAIIFLFLIPVFLYFYLNNKFGQNGVILTIVVLGIYALLFFLSKYTRVLASLIPCVLVLELTVNGVLTLQKQFLLNGDISQYQTYVTETKAQIAAVQKQEKDIFYRMDALQKRDDVENRCSAYLNEAMVYGYGGLNHYSSTYDSGLADLLYSIGYSTEDDLSIYSESILPSDSLLGIKYLLSEVPVAGYVELDSLSEADGKSVYQNSYALGLGMQASSSVYDSAESTNPFAYQNQLFSNILGRDVELYKKAEFTGSITDNTLTYEIAASGEKNLLYGYVDSCIEDLQLFVDGEYRCAYSTWLSYKTFFAGEGTSSHTVTLNQYTGTETEVTPYFYYLDQALFEEIIQELKQKEMAVTLFEDGHVKGTYAAAEDGNMLLTIPYDTGWSAYVNGEKVEVEEAANAFIGIPVVQGDNTIELKYQIPGLKSGIGFSLFGILIFLGFCRFERKRESRR